MKGKKVFRKICADAGGFEKARTANDMSNLLGQIYDISRKSISKQGELVELLDLCQKQKNTPDTFVRSVQTGDDFFIFLSTNQQLNNLKRFCVGKCCSILGVDPTFNICEYNVTISTYIHPLLIDKATKEHPVLRGPSITHSHKTFQSYLLLPSNMVQLEPSLQNIKAFRTDGEPNVYNALKASFPNADHLLSFIHTEDNVIKKCLNLNVDSRIYIKEIFGVKSGNTKVKGLVDCNSDEEFERECLRLVEMWKERPKGEDFINYMKKHKKQLIKQCMLASTREHCGLGSPPKHYNQNANEASNNMIKRAKGPNKLSMREAVQLMQQGVSG